MSQASIVCARDVYSVVVNKSYKLALGTWHWVLKVLSRHIIINDLWVSDHTVWAAGHCTLLGWSVYISCGMVALWREQLILSSVLLSVMLTVLLRVVAVHCTARLCLPSLLR